MRRRSGNACKGNEAERKVVSTDSSVTFASFSLMVGTSWLPSLHSLRAMVQCEKLGKWIMFYYLEYDTYISHVQNETNH